ncbi:hypothetical protein HFD88_008108 [Aspergillus terreus]|nr:hypothetical protein HFD88_008108 [Aspergillus terreus]
MSGLTSNITDTATGATSGAGAGGIASNATQSSSATESALPPGQLDIIKGVAGLNTNHKGEVIGLGRDDNNALINLLAREKMKKDKGTSDEELDKMSQEDILKQSGLNNASKEEIEELSKKDSVQKFKQEAQKKTVSSGVFYAYGVQKVGGLTKRFLYTFANASVANQYIQKLQDTYGAAVKRHGSQFFTLPDTPNPFTIAESQEFKQFEQKYIVEEAQAPQPIIPPMDAAGYSNTRGLGCDCTCGKTSETKGSGNTSGNSNVKPSSNTGGNSAANTNTTNNKGSSKNIAALTMVLRSQTDAGELQGTSDAELIRVASKIADEKKAKGDTRSYADIFAEAFNELKSTTKSK